ncbi:MAG: galactose mutarotase [Planctomycetes bacterium]|nr:galactose mutarotase [Planctomycetota bacterium]
MPASPLGAPSIEVSDWGTLEGKTVHLWTLRNATGMTMKVSDYGTIVTELWVPDAKGQMVDVVLGRPSLQAYIERTQYFGCTAGRCANRIAKGQFTIDGKACQVTCNNGPNCLHGGAKGFDKRLWDGKAGMVNGDPSITFTYVSAAGEEGFPGTCTAKVTYTLTAKNELAVDMQATTDAPTCVNLAHHTYWNLGGQGSGSILDHELTLNADRYTPVDAALITTGEITDVAGTPLDFRTQKAIGTDFAKLPATKDDPGGYDHNFVVNGAAGSMRTCATVRSPKTGIVMTVSSDQPGIQFYSGNFLDGVPGKGTATYAKNDGLCLETQAFPDSINKQGKAGWPDVVLRPGKTYSHRMVHAFSVKQ